MNIHIQCIIPLLLALEICDVQFPLETIVPMSTNIKPSSVLNMFIIVRLYTY